MTWTQIDFASVAVNLVTAITVAMITALLSVRLALRRFRAERFWERKTEAYVRVVEALHNAKAFAEDHVEAEITGHKLPDERDSELRRRARAGNDEVFKAIDTGALLLPVEAINRLRQYARESDDASKRETWFDYLTADATAARNCLQEITEIARRDLNIAQL